jgi:hypothetical protein
MASNYASSVRPAEVVVDAAGDPSGAPGARRVRLARRRERPDDLWRLEDQAASSDADDPNAGDPAART